MAIRASPQQITPAFAPGKSNILLFDESTVASAYGKGEADAMMFNATEK